MICAVIRGSVRSLCRTEPMMPSNQLIAAVRHHQAGQLEAADRLYREAIAANPKAVADFKNGKLKAADAIKGAVMRETRGMAQMEQVQRLMLQELEQA